MFTFSEVCRIANAEGALQGFDRCLFELRHVPLDDALDQFVTLWNEEKRRTFRAHVKAEPLDEITQQMVDSFRPGHVYVIAAHRRVLAKVWNPPYREAGDDIVALDANKRLSALAKRRDLGLRDDVEIRAFVAVAP